MRHKHNRGGKIFENRVRQIQALFLIFVVFPLIIYLFFVQIFDARRVKHRPDLYRTQKVFKLRGEIVDRNGLKLASDKTTFDLYANKKYFDHTPKELAVALAPILNIPQAHIEKILSSSDRKVILVAKDLERSKATSIQKLKYREFSLDAKNKRVYPQGRLAAHILGYYNPDADVASGVESSAKDDLEYIDKTITYEKTRDGNIIYNLSTNPADLITPQKGKTLNLTIDSAIQHVCERALFAKIKETSAKRGAVIVLNPKNGEILAFAVYPNYDPNEYKKFPMLDLKNWAISDIYPPGSTFKIITVASGLAAKVINKNSTVMDTGTMQIGAHIIKNHDYKTKPHPGAISLGYLFMHSSNVGAARIALMIPQLLYYDILKNLNFGVKTGIDLPGESSGLLPNPNKTKWSKSFQATMGFGYGSSVTTIQLASAIAAIANRGVWITPHVIKFPTDEIIMPEDIEGQKKLEELRNTDGAKMPRVMAKRVMTEQEAHDITNLLVYSVDNGSYKINNPNYSIAAKSGTSRKPNENALGFSNKLYTSMVGFLPASDPQVLIYVVIDSASGGGVWGSTIAGPVFKEISDDIIKIMNIKPDRHLGE